MRENSKKLLLALAAAALLTGCAADPGETTASTIPTTEPVAETTLPADTLYIPDSALERSTGGAVKSYEADGDVTGAAILGDQLLIALDENRLQLLSGDFLEVRKERALDFDLSWTDPSLVRTDTGMAFFEASTGAYVLLDADLVATARAAIDGELLCAPVISHDFTTIYYADAEGVKAMDFTSGITRMLRAEYGTVLSLEGLLFEDSLLHYTRQLEDGTVQHCFVGAADGSSKYTGRFQGDLLGWNSTVSGALKLDQPMQIQSWVIAGSPGSIRLLTNGEGWDGLLFPDENTVIIQQLNKVGLVLSRFDLTTGQLTARVTLPQQTEVFTAACTQGDLIWLCGTGSRFCSWDTAATAASGQTLTQADLLDDTAALSDIEKRAEALSDQYGVDIAFVQRDNRTEGMDYAGCPDYRADMYAAALDIMESALQQVPGEYWYQLARKTDSGRLRIRLVDSFDPAMEPTEGTGSFSVMGDELTIEVTVCADMEAIFFHQLWHVMEVRISSTTGKLNSWDKLNPKGFAYTGDYEAWERGEYVNSEYLNVGSSYFADDYGLVAAREDRAQIFMYAMMAGQEARFDSDAMQSKLARLCEIIRSVYKLSDETELPWEQYLK